MEIEFDDDIYKTKNNQLENDNSNKSENIQVNEDSSNKKLFILFISTILIIYIININFIYKKIYPKRKVIINADNLAGMHVIEDNLRVLKVDPLYKGPVFPKDGKITKDWILNLIEYMKDYGNNKTSIEKYLDRVYLLEMLLKVKNMYGAVNESLIDVTIPEDRNVTVVGDIHGQYYDLLNIFKINGYPSEENPYIFIGDYVDRGAFGLECMTTLIAFKILYPNHVFLSRGNHEDVDTNERYGFLDEIFDKYDENIFNCFSELFRFLPLGHVLNKKILIIHGGLFSQDGVTLDDIKKIYRFQAVPISGLMTDLLWSDPKAENGRTPSARGAGVYFGPDVTEKFLKQNNLTLLVRAHEVRMEGYAIEPGNKVITVFSAPNYCDIQGNKGAIIIFNGRTLTPHFIQFDATPHP
jgi:serine/threonine-protein phosphatase 5